jgi:hypothetical protein
MNIENCHRCGEKIQSGYLIEVSDIELMSLCSQDCFVEYANRLYSEIKESK